MPDETAEELSNLPSSELFDPREGLPPPCEGCRTGNPFKCRSFSGTAPLHAQYETDYANWKNRAGLKVLLSQANELSGPTDTRVFVTRVDTEPADRNAA